MVASQGGGCIRMHVNGAMVNYTVRNPGDSGSGSGTDGDLRYCITQANLNPDSTITFTSAGTVTLASRLPVITDTMTNHGGGFSPQVSGGGQNRVFFVDAPCSAVVFSGLNIVDGKATGGAGGFPVGGAGAGLGGGLFVNDGAVTLIDVSFTNNSAVGAKGGDGSNMFSGGGGEILRSVPTRTQPREIHRPHHLRALPLPRTADHRQRLGENRVSLLRPGPRRVLQAGPAVNLLSGVSNGNDSVRGAFASPRGSFRVAEYFPISPGPRVSLPCTGKVVVRPSAWRRK